MLLNWCIKFIFQVKDQSRKISVQIGWMNFSYKDQRYIIIKSTKDHPDSGPRLYKVESSLTVQGLLPKLKDIFFPGHKSPLGSEKKFHFSVGNFNGDMLEPSMTLGEYTQGTSKQRMYLLSKQVICRHKIISFATLEPSWINPLQSYWLIWSFT